MKILVVDDSDDMRMILGRFLRTQRFEVFFAKDGLEGLERAKEIKPDLILLDVDMPKMNGIAVCGFLRKESETGKTPIIFLTSDDKIGTVEDALEKGANGYLFKPFDFTKLSHEIDKVLSH